MQDDASGAGTTSGMQHDAAVGAAVDALLAALTPDEKLHCLSGDQPWLPGLIEMARRYNATPIVAGAVPRLGIPGIRFTDGPRGVVMGSSTAFCSALARGASFDPGLEAEVMDAIGREAAAQGANLFAGICLNLLRHPAWGRAQECYGEDPHLTGEMGAAAVAAVQRHVMACIKHFAVNSVENARFWIDVDVDPADLDDVYLPQFRRALDAGAVSVMSAYNKANGEFCGANAGLLRDTLKHDWGFDGFVMSDFFLGVRGSGAACLNAGLDLEMPFRFRFGGLGRAIRRGTVSWARVDDAVRRLLRAQVRFGLIDGDAARRAGVDVAFPPAVFGTARNVEAEADTADAATVVACDAHRALARRAAAAGSVLLRNERAALPFGRDVASLALVGRLGDIGVTGDLGSSQVRAPEVVPVHAGLRAAAAARGVGIVDVAAAAAAGADVAAQAALAAAADAAVVVVGTTHADEGEWIGAVGGDRVRLTLRPDDEALIRAVAAANPRTVVVLVGGSAFVTDTWRDDAAAILAVWYPGMEGGHAVADMVFGDVEPGGRLPVTWPAADNDLPTFDRFARRLDYGPLFGYRQRSADGTQPAFWFGHGLGYTTFVLGAAQVVDGSGDADAAAEHTVTVRVEATNTGDRSGAVVVQAYVDERPGTAVGAVPTLRGFAKATVAAGATATLTFDVACAAPDAPIRVGLSADPAALVCVAG